jgi:hypothetical protein
LVAPSAWGTQERLRELFGDRVSTLEIRREHADFCYPDTAALFEVYRDWFGPVSTTWQMLSAAQREEYRESWIALADECNIAQDGTCEIPSDYLEVVAVKH